MRRDWLAIANQMALIKIASCGQPGTSRPAFKNRRDARYRDSYRRTYPLTAMNSFKICFFALLEAAW